MSSTKPRPRTGSEAGRGAPPPLPDWAQAQEKRAVRQWAVEMLRHLEVSLPEHEALTLPGFLKGAQMLVRFAETGEISQPPASGEG